MKVEYKGYIISQSSLNYHIMITKNDEMIMHISATRQYSEDELKNTIKLYEMLVSEEVVE